MEQRKKENGFTLVELVVVMVLVVILAGVAAPLLAVSLDAFTLKIERTELEESANLALARISREIRRLRDEESVLTADASEFEFVDTDGRTIRYWQENDQLLRQENGGDEIELAGFVQNNGLAFRYLDDDGTQIANPAEGAGTKTDIRRVEVQIAFENNGHVVPVQIQIQPRNLRHEADLFVE
jgi:prepilin-type N-terminal cleavage/methylation domain-containing protein